MNRIKGTLTRAVESAVRSGEGGSSSFGEEGCMEMYGF